MNYTQARKNAYDFRQYIARRVASDRAMGRYNVVNVQHAKVCARELARMTGLTFSEVWANVELDVMVIEALAA